MSRSVQVRTKELSSTAGPKDVARVQSVSGNMPCSCAGAPRVRRATLPSSAAKVSVRQPLTPQTDVRRA